MFIAATFDLLSQESEATAFTALRARIMRARVRREAFFCSACIEV
jgi:hypothetical protein